MRGASATVCVTLPSPEKQRKDVSRLEARDVRAPRDGIDIPVDLAGHAREANGSAVWRTKTQMILHGDDGVSTTISSDIARRISGARLSEKRMPHSHLCPCCDSRRTAEGAVCIRISRSAFQ